MIGRGIIQKRFEVFRIVFICSVPSPFSVRSYAPASCKLTPMRRQMCDDTTKPFVSSSSPLTSIQLQYRCVNTSPITHNKPRSISTCV